MLKRRRMQFNERQKRSLPLKPSESTFFATEH
jgi:hypothetical protein